MSNTLEFEREKRQVENARKNGFCLSLEQFEEMLEDYGGLCLYCGEEAFGVEPDARQYRCDACGMHAVYGCEEVLQWGLVR